MKITSSKNNYQFSDSEYGYITLSANQTTDITAGDPIKFNTLNAGNVTFNPATYRVTLKKNRTYRLFATCLVFFSSASSEFYARFYNVTTSALFGEYAYTHAYTSVSHYAPQLTCYATITPTVDTIVECRIITPTNLGSIRSGYSYWEIQQLNVVSPVIQDPTRQVAYTSPQLNLTVTGGAGFSLIRGVGVFYKTNDGAWRARGNIVYTQTSSATCNIALTGVVFKNVANYYQTFSADPGGVGYATYAYCNPNTSIMSITSSVATTSCYVSFDVELNAKPTGYAQIPADV